MLIREPEDWEESYILAQYLAIKVVISYKLPPICDIPKLMEGNWIWVESDKREIKENERDCILKD